MDSYDKILNFGREKFGVCIKFKDKSFFMKVLGKILFFNPSFMQRYITTIGSTVYFPSEEWLKDNRESAASILAHEIVHVSDSKVSNPFIFSYSYLTPQVFAILSLMAIFSSPWWLLSLVFLAPIPSPFRTYWELRGYAISDAVRYKTSGEFLPKEFITKQFVSSAYFWMWPFESDIDSRIEENRQLILKGKLSLKIDIADEILNCF